MRTRIARTALQHRHPKGVIIIHTTHRGRKALAQAIRSREVLFFYIALVAQRGLYLFIILCYQLFSFFGVPLRAGLSATTPRLPALASASTEGALWGIRCYPSRR